MDTLHSCCDTERDKQMISLLAAGHTQAEVASRLNISERTVRNSKAKIEQRFDAHQYALSV